jgi:hypothetical protein
MKRRRISIKSFQKRRKRRIANILTKQGIGWLRSCAFREFYTSKTRIESGLKYIICAHTSVSLNLMASSPLSI